MNRYSENSDVGNSSGYEVSLSPFPWATGATTDATSEVSAQRETVNLTILVTSKVDPDSLPLYFTQMSTTSRNCVLAYSVLFIIAATGNLSVLMSVLRRLRKPKSKSRICVLILHLSIADLMVTFFVMPIEIFWRLSVGWYVGNVLCKICQFLRAFGLYLSSMVLICISLDRYFAIIHPLLWKSGAERGVRSMLICAWIASALISLPQSVIFRVKRHPSFPSFLQCVSLDFFNSAKEEVAYNVVSLCMMYFIPLFAVIFTCSHILWKIHIKSRQQHERLDEDNGKILLRRISGNSNLERAKIQTLRLFLLIILVFLLCWTPYVIITLWYMLDRENAVKLNPDVQEGLFLMAVANSCINPFVYGSFTKRQHGTVIQYYVSETHRLQISKEQRAFS